MVTLKSLFIVTLFCLFSCSWTILQASTKEMTELDADCVVFRCRGDRANEIPQQYWYNDAYICENGGANCELYPIPGAPAECDPVKVCYFDSIGYIKTTWQCTTDTSGTIPECTFGHFDRAVILLHTGESTGQLDDVISSSISPASRVRRAIICLAPVLPAIYDCSWPQSFTDWIHDRQTDWVNNGEVASHSYYFHCTEGGCVKEVLH